MHMYVIGTGCVGKLGDAARHQIVSALDSQPKLAHAIGSALASDMSPEGAQRCAWSIYFMSAAAVRGKFG